MSGDPGLDRGASELERTVLPTHVRDRSEARRRLQVLNPTRVGGLACSAIGAGPDPGPFEFPRVYVASNEGFSYAHVSSGFHRHLSIGTVGGTTCLYILDLAREQIPLHREHFLRGRPPGDSVCDLCVSADRTVEREHPSSIWISWLDLPAADRALIASLWSKVSSVSGVGIILPVGPDLVHLSCESTVAQRASA